MCGAQVPPTGPGRYSSWAEVSSLELHLHWGNTLYFNCLHVSHHVSRYLVIWCVLPEQLFLFSHRIMPLFHTCISLWRPRSSSILSLKTWFWQLLTLMWVTQTVEYIPPAVYYLDPNSPDLFVFLVLMSYYRWQWQCPQKVQSRSTAEFPGGSYWWLFWQESWFWLCWCFCSGRWERYVFMSPVFDNTGDDIGWK